MDSNIMPIDKLNKKEVKELKRFLMTKNKKKLSKTAERGDALNKLISEKVSREETEPTQESPMQVELDKAKFLADIYQSFQQTPQYNQGNQGNNNQMSFRDFIELAKTYNKNNNGGGKNSDFIKFMDMMLQSQNKNMELMMQNFDQKFGYMIQNRGQPQESPRDNLREDLKFFRELSGDKRVRTKDEMEFGLRREELILKNQERGDMLDREERAIMREDKKSERILDIGGVVLNKVIGNNLGSLVNDLMGSGKNIKARKRRGRTNIPKDDDFDVSLLDDLNG